MTIVGFGIHCLPVIADLMTMMNAKCDHDQLRYLENSCFLESFTVRVEGKSERYATMRRRQAQNHVT